MLSPKADKSRGAALRSLRGGRSFVPSGWQASSSDITHVVVVAAQPPILHAQSPPSSPVAYSSPNVLINSLGSQGNDLTLVTVLPPNSSTHISPLRIYPGKGKSVRPNRSTSPPPVLHS